MGLADLTNNNRPLVAVKLLHTAVWAVFAGSLVALPVLGAMRRIDWALAVNVLLLFECDVMAINHGRCPLTDVAARYTDDRAYNFDIYLPNWLAKHNKAAFGTLFVIGDAVVLWRWLR